MKKLVGSIIVSSFLAIAAVVGIGIWPQTESTPQAFEGNNPQTLASSSSSLNEGSIDESSDVPEAAPAHDSFHILPLPDRGDAAATADFVETVPAPAHDGFHILPLPEDVQNEAKADVADAPAHDDGFYILPLPWDTSESERELAR